MNALFPPNETEGVIKYRLDFAPGPAPDGSIIAALNAWRGLLFRLGLNGRDPQRYDGLAYGNVSLRIDARRFWVSGTQTGGLSELTTSHYTLVTDFDIGANQLAATGPLPPSSEALTHAAAYAADETAGSVLHVHSPRLWEVAGALGIPVTPVDVAYGTPAMADCVGALLRRGGAPIIAMGGHRDGLIAVGDSPEAAAIPLIKALAAAMQRAACSA